MHFHSLYELVCSPEIFFQAAAGRKRLFLDVIEKRTAMPIEKGKQVKQIVDLLVKIVEELDSDSWGKADGAMDPFETKSNLFGDI